MARRRRTNRSTNLLSRIKRSVARENHGTKIKGPSDPPMIVQAPWWPLTLVTASNGSTKFTPAIIYKAITNQIPDFKSPAANVEMRFMSVRAWRKDGPIQLKINNLINGQMIEQYGDMPAPMTYAHVGWRYGKSQQLISLNCGNEMFEMFQIDIRQKDKENPCIVYLHCMIKLTASTAVAYDILSGFNTMTINDDDHSYEMV